jgi:hypothetical protein
MMLKQTSAAFIGFTAAASAVVAVGLSTAPAAAASPHSFTLHLTCDNDQSYDILVNDGHSVAALVNGSNAVAVLKNGNGTVVPAFAEGGPLAGTLVSCDTGIPGFTALVLFTPAA